MKKKTTKKSSTRVSNVVKTRNSGTMTESMFLSFIRSALRQKSRWWKPVSECKQNAKRVYVGNNKRQKFEYQCNQCKNWFPDKEINVDHIIPAGSLKSLNDLPQFVEQLFVEVDKLQCLCVNCHYIKTQAERKK
jgi:hypothetical protein